MKESWSNFHCNKTNGTVENSNIKLKIYNFSQEALKLEWQSIPTNLTLKMQYVSAFRTNIHIKYEKVNILT